MRYLYRTLSIGLIVAADVAHGVEVYFWSTGKAPPANVRLDGHPCGGVVILDVDRIPSDSEWLIASIVREVNSSGKTLQTWRTPVDYYPVALDGSTLFLEFGSSPKFTLRALPDGRIAQVSKLTTPPFESRSCPSTVEEGMICVETRKTPRTFLAYYEICT